LKEQAHVYLHGVKVEKGGIVHVPALLDWYHKDFGKHLPEVVAEVIVHYDLFLLVILLLIWQKYRKLI
tara:strand:- start:2026 stop:2229 length:204 start_codon:yes stop_codon:yes gene_type:complete